MSDISTLYTTERLVVRRLFDYDLDAMHSVYGDVEVNRFVDDGQPLSREQCDEWIEITKRNYRERGYGMSAIVLTDSAEVIGFVGVVHPKDQREAELKYALARGQWGQGLATEAARGMLEYAQRRLGLTRVIATIHPAHVKSQAVALKAGMRFVRELANSDGTTTHLYAWVAE